MAPGARRVASKQICLDNSGEVRKKVQVGYLALPIPIGGSLMQVRRKRRTLGDGPGRADALP
jgi:hypothetical protein